MERAEIIRNNGTNRKQFLRGQVDKYTWVEVGSSYVPSELCCAFLYGQLELLDIINVRRKRIHAYYRDRLAPLEAEGLLRLPQIPDNCTSNCHLFYILVPDLATRQGLLKHLNRQGIQATFHYVPLHSSPMGKRFGYRDGMLPVTENLSERLVRLPFYHEISETEQAEVVDQIRAFLLTPTGVSVRAVI